LAEEGTRTAERRINSTIAHEAGHGLLHASVFTADHFASDLFQRHNDVSARKILCRDEAEATRGGYDGRWWEYQANRMIGCLLLPKPLVLAAVERFLSAGGIFNAPVLRPRERDRATNELVELFDVNRPVATRRLAMVCPPGTDAQLTL
jgi:hypothetical protein